MAISGRYFRFRATADNYSETGSVYLFLIKEIEAFESSDLTGSDVLASGTADASSEWDSSYSADKAIDGSLVTRWASNPTPSEYQWWRCDCGSSKTIRSVRVYTWDNSGLHPSEAVLEASNDGSNWTTFATIEPPNSLGQWLNFTDLQSVSGHFPLINGFGRAGKLVS